MYYIEICEVDCLFLKFLSLLRIICGNFPPPRVGKLKQITFPRDKNLGNKQPTSLFLCNKKIVITWEKSEVYFPGAAQEKNLSFSSHVIYCFIPC